MPPKHLVIDCANGVGAIALRDLMSHLPSTLHLTLTHTQVDQPNLLNAQCGADYVKTHQRSPDPLLPDTLYASLDGDADRVIFYYHDGSQFKLLDGDKIACLFATYLQGTISNTSSIHSTKVSLGVVQTAYANGQSTQYLNQLGVSVVCVPTGVKHLHAAAHQFDIGVYFEANGHGTILFQSPWLSPLSNLLNPTVGDAIADVLAVMVVLEKLQWKVSQWDQLFQEWPNQLWKVHVHDRKIFTTTNAERSLVSPPSIQKWMDQAVNKVNGRAFVRPSGTENVVRVYAEAPTLDACLWLGQTVAGLVFDLGGGAGERPSSFLKWEEANEVKKD
ncbi:Phosphoacetylglucosamine Mutase [Coelomomyces lativittatus]|nr:Phosphoacetylglucosamine Mutase [Coelomomyces lativittatus]